MDSGNYAPTGASYGEFTIMQMSGTPTAKASSFQKEDFVAKYALSNRTLTARELAMVPTLPDWYIIPKEVVRVCEHAKVTTASSQPMRNFLFRGEAGTGKTMGAQAIAAGLNLPYTLMTCSANTEITDLVGQFIPDTNGFHGSTPIEDLPKISDITMHPPSVYMMLTGEYDEEKTEDDVLQKLIEIAVGNLVEKEETPGQRIRYVDTPLVEAIRHGYVCELQEPSCIANPGVLVGLNSLLDNCQVITLPTGERVKRHPDTNPYWVDMREAMDRFTLSYDYTHLSTFYADLVEYIVMTVRLYFFIREKQFRPIDRGKYDELVGVKAALPTPA